MSSTLLGIIPATVKIAKLLPVLCIFTGFQAHAAPITTFGNLSYDGTLINGDGRTYVGLDTLAPLTYQQTLDKIEDDPIYAEYRIADTADADYFINSIFGDTGDSSCTDDYDKQTTTSCGTVTGWYDGAFGDNSSIGGDQFWFIANELVPQEVGQVKWQYGDELYKTNGWGSIDDSDRFVVNNGAYGERMVTWLLVTDSIASNAVPTPSSFAIFVLGFAGIGFTRRRRS
jgi:hypothetical protein